MQPFYCSSCGKPNAPYARFCNACAKPMSYAPPIEPVWQPVTQIACSSCRMMNPSNYEFCHLCKKPLFYSQPIQVPEPQFVNGPSGAKSLGDLASAWWAKRPIHDQLMIIGFSILGFIAFVAIVIAVPNIQKNNAERGSSAYADKPTTPETPATTPQPTPTDAPKESRNPAEALKKARQALAFNYVPKGKNKSWGKIAEARMYLDTIQQSDKEYAEAQKLYKEIERREAEIEIWSKAAAREYYANEMETNFLKQGMDISVSVLGEANTTVKLKYVLITRVWAFQWFTNQDLMSKIRSYGFKKIILTDGYRQSFSNDL